MLPTGLYICYIAVAFLFGLVFGSFVGACVARIPEGQSIVPRSHCDSCGHALSFLDLIPIVSYVALRGRCRYCHSRIPISALVIETADGLMWVLVHAVLGPERYIEAVLVSLMGSMLLALSLIDWRTYEIPPGFNIAITVLGVLRLIATGFANWSQYLIGAVCVSVPLTAIYLISKGAAIGGGDCKLMFAAGLFLGWQKCIFALVIGCIVGSVTHLIRMKISHSGHTLAMGPYLSIGIMAAALWGDLLVGLYMRYIGLL